MARSRTTHGPIAPRGPKPGSRRRAVIRRGLAAAVVLAVLGTALVVWAGGSQPTSDRRTEGPNVLIIITDDQRAGFEVMDATQRLFGDGGRRYLKAFASTPSCCPSRASIFTGRYAHNHGVTNNENVDRLDHGQTLQRLLQETGYTTAIFGKYLNSFKGQRPPYFDRWSVSTGSAESGYEEAVWNDQGELRSVDDYSTNYIADEAVEFIEGAEANDGDPWLMYLTPHAPHRPFVPEERYEEAEVPDWDGNPGVFEQDLSDKPPFVRNSRVPSRNGFIIRRRQLRTLISVDALVADVFEQMKESGEAEDTLVVFMSDNGVHWAEHGMKNKLTPYTQSIAIPLFLRWPGEIGPGTTDTRIVGNIDVAPTVLDAAGLTEEAEGMDGRSLLDGSWSRNRMLTEFEADADLPFPTWASTRTERFQYIEYYGDDGETVVFREYYDLVKDPWQLENVLADGDPLNDPDLGPLSKQLAEDRTCSLRSCP